MIHLSKRIRFSRFYLDVIELDLIGSRFFVFRYYRIELRFFMDSVRDPFSKDTLIHEFMMILERSIEEEERGGFFNERKEKKRRFKV